MYLWIDSLYITKVQDTIFKLVKLIIQNHNVSLSCKWTAVTAKPPKKIPRHVPLHLRKKMREKPPPNFFEVNPSSGVLLPGKTADIKIVFMPSEEVYVHTHRITSVISRKFDHNFCFLARIVVSYKYKYRFLRFYLAK